MGATTAGEQQQRYTTVMLHATPQFVDEVLWPELEKLSETLHAYSSEVTSRVISQAVHADLCEAGVAKELGS